ncbi:MAG: hypothetical protein N3D17_00150 [bacterium]|nr:hypothetical protein [bacterium]
MEDIKELILFRTLNFCRYSLSPTMLLYHIIDYCEETDFAVNFNEKGGENEIFRYK